MLLVKWWIIWAQSAMHSAKELYVDYALVMGLFWAEHQ